MASGKLPIQHVWVITGPAGCGKTTVAAHLAANLHLPYLEGDDYHTEASVAKMHSNQPLQDVDRWDWLGRLKEAAVEKLLEGYPGVVVTCSALKKKYRDVLRMAVDGHQNFRVHFVYLHANKDLLIQRVKARQGHYMKDSMVQSQFDSLEEPTSDERDCLKVDVSGPSVDVQDMALATVERALEEAVSQTL